MFTKNKLIKHFSIAILVIFTCAQLRAHTIGAELQTSSVMLAPNRSLKNTLMTSHHRITDGTKADDSAHAKKRPQPIARQVLKALTIGVVMMTAVTTIFFGASSNHLAASIQSEGDSPENDSSDENTPDTEDESEQVNNDEEIYLGDEDDLGPSLAEQLLNMGITSKQGFVGRGRMDPVLEANISRHQDALAILSQLTDLVEVRSVLVSEIENDPARLSVELDGTLQEITEALNKLLDINFDAFKEDGSFQNAIKTLLNSLQKLLDRIRDRLIPSGNPALALNDALGGLENYLNKKLGRGSITHNHLKTIKTRLESARKLNLEQLKKKTEDTNKKKKRKKKKKSQTGPSNAAPRERQPDQGRQQANTELSIDELVSEALSLDPSLGEVTHHLDGVPRTIQLANGNRIFLSQEARQNILGQRRYHTEAHIVPLDLIATASSKHIKTVQRKLRKKNSKNFGQPMVKHVYNFYHESRHCFYRFVFGSSDENQAVLITAFRLEAYNVKKEGLTPNTDGVKTL